VGLLTRQQFSKRIGQGLRRQRQKRALSRQEVADRLNQSLGDHEWHLRVVAALSVTATHIRWKKGLTCEQVAERGNLPMRFVRNVEAGKILDPDLYLVYCLTYRLRTPFSKFIKKVHRLSRTELDEHDRPIRRKRKNAPLPQPHQRLLLGSGNRDYGSAVPREEEHGTTQETSHD
jgi:transcriptional regulator with XRE-family HTH domain